MFTEKSKLVEKRENPFYGSYKENSILEEIHWQNKRKRQQLAMVSGVILILVMLAIGITLAITLPPLLDIVALNPPDTDEFLGPSPSLLLKMENGGVASESDICSQMGRDILENKSGSAVDAAVGVTLCHGVTVPQSSGLGGGLFMVIYMDGVSHVVNAREIAPSNVDPKIYENEPQAALKGGRAVGVPGELAGLWAAHQRFGNVAWSELVSPVTKLALDGFIVSPYLAKTLKQHEQKIKSDPTLSSEFVDPSTGLVWTEGSLLKRPRLAATLQQLEVDPIAKFYNGTLASEIVQEVGDAKGIITLGDLDSFSVSWDDIFEYGLTGNLTLVSPSLPSSGPVVGMALGILHSFGKKNSVDLDLMERGADEHLLAEVLKFAHAHRAMIADPDFTDMTELLDQLSSPSYAAELGAAIDPYKTFASPEHYGGIYSVNVKDEGTSQISILGPNGDAVSITTSINHGFGAGFMGATTGLIYNNIMGDFSISNASDVFGLTANEFNGIEPGKRPGSSMSPIVLLNDQRQPVLASGGAGGEQILSAVISTTWRALYRNLDIKQAIDYPRISPQFEPHELLYEYGFPAPLVDELRRRGHVPHRVDTVASTHQYIGAVNAVCRTREGGLILSNADSRKGGDSAGY